MLNCLYHTDRDAVNVCSRCEEAICSECNYVTGTSPICRNCWDELVSAGRLGVGSKPKKIVKPEIQKEFLVKEHIDKEDEAPYSAPLKQEAVSSGDIAGARVEPRLQIDKAANFIGFGLDRMGDGIIFSIEKLVNVFTWLFSSMGRKSKK